MSIKKYSIWNTSLKASQSLLIGLKWIELFMNSSYLTWKKILFMFVYWANELSLAVILSPQIPTTIFLLKYEISSNASPKSRTVCDWI